MFHFIISVILFIVCMVCQRIECHHQTEIFFYSKVIVTRFWSKVKNANVSGNWPGVSVFVVTLLLCNSDGYSCLCFLHHHVKDARCLQQFFTRRAEWVLFYREDLPTKELWSSYGKLLTQTKAFNIVGWLTLFLKRSKLILIFFWSDMTCWSSFELKHHAALKVG